MAAVAVCPRQHRIALQLRLTVQRPEYALPPLLLPAGWRFNGKGECTKMPSTNLCRGVAGEAGLGAAPPAGLPAPLR